MLLELLATLSDKIKYLQNAKLRDTKNKAPESEPEVSNSIKNDTHFSKP